MNIIILAVVSTLSPLLPLLISRFRSRNDPELRLILLLLGLALVFDLASMVAAMNKVNSFFVGNLFYLVQTLLLLQVYRNQVHWFRKIHLVTAVAYVIFFTVNYFFIQGYDVLNTYTITLSTFLFVALSLAYFLDTLKKMPEVYVHRMPMIWINIAVFVYYAGNLLVFVFNDYLIMNSTWIIHNMLNIAKNLLFTVAIWQSQRKTSSSSS